MAKCSICGEKIAELFFDKVKGTIVKKTGSSKLNHVCFACQKKFRTKQEQLEKINKPLWLGKE